VSVVNDNVAGLF